MRVEKKIILIIPAFNEESNILHTYQSIEEYNRKHGTNYDVIVINDGSVDKTRKILVRNNIPHISLIRNLGIGGAVQTGYKYALDHKYDIAVQFDGDGQHDISGVQKITAPILSGEADFCIGSRFIQNINDNFRTTASRRMGIRIISSFIRFVTGVKVYDTTSGFRAVNRKVMKEFSCKYPIEYPEPITTTEMLKKGYRVKEVPVLMHERQGGTSSIASWKNIYYMVNVLLTILIMKLRRYEG